jgi:hypothetical protein
MKQYCILALGLAWLTTSSFAGRPSNGSSEGVNQGNGTAANTPNTANDGVKPETNVAPQNNVNPPPIPAAADNNRINVQSAMGIMGGVTGAAVGVMVGSVGAEKLFEGKTKKYKEQRKKLKQDKQDIQANIDQQNKELNAINADLKSTTASIRELDGRTVRDQEIMDYVTNKDDKKAQLHNQLKTNLNYKIQHHTKALTDLKAELDGYKAALEKVGNQEDGASTKTEKTKSYSEQTISGIETKIKEREKFLEKMQGAFEVLEKDSLPLSQLHSIAQDHQLLNFEESSKIQGALHHIEKIQKLNSPRE